MKSTSLEFEDKVYYDKIDIVDPFFSTINVELTPKKVVPIVENKVSEEEEEPEYEVLLKNLENSISIVESCFSTLYTCVESLNVDDTLEFDDNDLDVEEELDENGAELVEGNENADI